MNIQSHTLGFPRIGVERELKKALERYWSGDIDRESLFSIGRELRARHWQQQREAGIDLLPVGDFAGTIMFWQPACYWAMSLSVIRAKTEKSILILYFVLVEVARRPANPRLRQR